MKFARAILPAGVCAYALAAAAQTQMAVKPAQRTLGEVTALDTQARQITIKADNNGPATILLGEKTLYLRVPPGEKDLAKAARIALSDISVGDRVLARGQVSEDQKSIAATSVIMMSKSELSRKHELDREEWQRRGIAGTVAALDPASRRITVSLPALAGARTVTVEPSESTDFRRYAPDSVRFSDARPSSFAELRQGDHVRVLGDKNEDGSVMKAERIVSGAFRTIAATVSSVDAATGELKVTDLASRKPLIVRVNADSSLRKMPPMVAMFMGRRLQAGPGGPGARPGGGGPPGEQHGAGGFGHGAGDMQQMLDRMPAFTLGELKPGDALIISSTAGMDPARVTAITLVAGVEPLLTAAPESARQLGGMWNLGEIPLPQ